jgi:SAM-dependent methyltransferase
MTSADEIVKRAMADRVVYDAMARREGEVFGTVLPQRAASGQREIDQKAAAQLRLNRNLGSLVQWARKAGRTFTNGLSLGCGEGRAERDIARAGICKRFLGIDVADSALRVARERAMQGDFEASYEQVDINFVELQPESFDLIVAQTSLHHVLHLEYVAEQLAKALKPGGILWVHDYIGESQFQYSDTRIDIANKIIAALPERCRYDRIFGRQLRPVVRRLPGTLISPFESIRSGEIPGIFLSRFDVVHKVETSTILHLVVPPGTRAAYTESDDARALFENIFSLDEILLETGILSPVAGQYVLTR